MLFLLSPAKRLDFDETPLEKASQPQFPEDTAKLVRKMRRLNRKEIRSLMSISHDLAVLNQIRFRKFNIDEEPSLDNGAKQALLAFAGDTYRDMELEEYDDEDYDYAQDHVRILSGLYGVLRPLDLIQPYRLEMGSRLETKRGKRLYDFWGDRIAKSLNETLEKLDDPLTINVASNEYVKAIDKEAFKGRMVKFVFKDWKKGKYKVVSFYAKRARGAITSWAVRNRIETLEELKGWTEQGYAYDEERSSEDEFVFLRREE